MEIFGWIIFVVVALYMTAVGLIAATFGEIYLCPISRLKALGVFVVFACIWVFVWMTCPFSIQLNQ